MSADLVQDWMGLNQQDALEFVYRPQVVELAPSPDAGPTVNFRGRVVERGTRDPLGGAQVVVNRCFQGATEFCPYVTRDASNQITLVQDVSCSLR